MTRLRVGPGEDATRAQRDRLVGLLNSTPAAGAQAVGRGSLLHDLDPEGYWVIPTLLAGVSEDHPLNTAKIFGPLLSIVPVDDPQEGIDVINADPHGLVTAAHTRDLGTTGRFVW